MTALKKLAASPLAVSLCLFTGMLCVASPLLYHGDNLTFCHALYLNDTPSPHWLHPSYLLSYLLCKLAPLVPWVNVYLLYLYGLLVCSAAAVLHVTRAAGKEARALRVLGLLTACYIIFQVPMYMEYTWISFLAAGCGCMLVFHHLYRGGTRVATLLPGLLLFVGGAVLRYDSCPAFAPFVAAASLFCWRPGSTAKARVASLIAPAACMASLLGIYALQPLPAKGEWQGEGNVVTVNLGRIDIYDYPDRSGVDKAADYRAMGVSPACMDMLQNYFCCDENTMTSAWWEQIRRIRKAGAPTYAWGAETWQSMGDILLLCHKRFLLLLLLAAVGVWMRRGTWRLYPLAMVLVYFLCIFLCCAKGRCHLTPIMSLAYFYVPMLLIPCGVREKLPRFLNPVLVSRATAAAVALAIAAILAVNSTQLLALGGFRHHYAQTEARAALQDWLLAHPDCPALADCDVYRDLGYPSSALLLPRSPYLPRLIELGNWPSTLPYRHAQRLQYGIPNEILALANPRARLVLGPQGLMHIQYLLDYLRSQYGLNLVPEHECDLAGKYAVYKLVAP